MSLKHLMCCLACAALAACGGGGGGGDSDGGGDSASDDTLQGFFLDDAVHGLIVETGSGPAQTTDENGVFSYRIDEPVTFKVDNVVIGTLPSGAFRIVPNDFGSTNVNIARFMQSIDTTPNDPGIDILNLDLPDVPINFNQGNTSFAMDPQVLAAVTAAGTQGGTGILVSQTTASENIRNSTSTVLEAADFDDQVYYPVSAAGPNEPCLAFSNDDGTGWNVCQNDIDEDPGDPTETFTWSIQSAQVVLEFGTEERVTISQLGTTGNRRHADVASECLPCDPNVEPAIEVELQTLYQALPLTDTDFINASPLNLTDSEGETLTAVFNNNATATVTDSGGTTDFEWRIDMEYPMLVLEGTGTPGSDLPYNRVVLVQGTVANGVLIALTGLATDDGDGTVDGADFAASGVYAEVLRLGSN